ncbi:MAG: RNA methyltransferase [Desulfovibrio sp.]|nr:RNA methyltransferase [Desulfovibrio sp.]
MKYFGRGGAGRFGIHGINKQDVRMERLEELIFSSPEARAGLALSLSKTVRRGFFLKKAVELGADAIWIWQADHSQNKLSSFSEQSWKEQMIAGAKQCKNPWLPELRLLSRGIDDVVKLASPADQRILLWERQDNISLLSPWTANTQWLTVYDFGSEGGFSSREFFAITAAGFIASSLGTCILQCETAATLCLGLHLWASHLNDFSTGNTVQ